MESYPRDSGRHHRELHGSCRTDRARKCHARGGSGLRVQHHRRGDSVPSCGTAGRRTVRLPLGRRAQAGFVEAGDCSVTSAARTRCASADPALASVPERVAAIDWAAIATGLDAVGCATTGPLLRAEECDALARIYGSDAAFRSRVMMGRHGFGRGEYKYFAYPLPDLVAELRTALYPPLAEIANRWNAAMGEDVRYPRKHADYLAHCHQTGQSKPTPLLLQYGEGDFNCLHQDLYGELIF